jgi:predicted metal-dependent phosphotriesterase family hydrolase
MIDAAAALPRAVSAGPSFPEGAVIRTILKDYPPEGLGGGATLFHEHMSGEPDIMVRFRKYTAEAQAVNRPPNAPSPAAAQGPDGPPPDLSFMRDLDLLTEELAIAKREGIACIVDAGHADIGRDTGFLRQLSLRSGMPIVAAGGYYT